MRPEGNRTSLPLAAKGRRLRTGTHSGVGLAKELEQIDLIRREGVALGADGMRGIQGRDTLQERGRHAELAELRLERVRRRIVVDHDRTCKGGDEAAGRVL